MIAANPHGGFNSYWPMPFQRHAELTVENLGDIDVELYYRLFGFKGGSGCFGSDVIRLRRAVSEADNDQSL